MLLQLVLVRSQQAFSSYCSPKLSPLKLTALLGELFHQAKCKHHLYVCIFVAKVKQLIWKWSQLQEKFSHFIGSTKAYSKLRESNQVCIWFFWKNLGCDQKVVSVYNVLKNNELAVLLLSFSLTHTDVHAHTHPHIHNLILFFKLGKSGMTTG